MTDKQQPAIIPVLLSGGSGTRLWPASRKACPKQFLRFVGERTLIEGTLLRCQQPAFDPSPIIIAAESHRFLVAENVRKLGIKADILLEPESKNSCAAVAAGAIQALNRRKDAMILVLATDHWIEDETGFHRSVMRGIAAARSGRLVIFGVKPDYPATGYGYVLPGKKSGEEDIWEVEKFTEKPNLAEAKRLLDEGNFWNSGNFLFEAGRFLEELKCHAPEVFEAVSEAHRSAEKDLDFLRLGPEPFQRCPSISVDHAIMEKTQLGSVVGCDHDWSDIGNWKSVWKKSPKDSSHNVIAGKGVVCDGSNNLVHSPEVLTTLLGVEGLVVAASLDSVLVTKLDRAEEVGSLVSKLVDANHPEAMAAPRVYRPWGFYEVLDKGAGFLVKRILVRPGGVLSLQKHEHRSEHWVVVEGTPTASIDGETFRLGPNESKYVPKGIVHRLENSGECDAVLIEVQTGSYLDETDIIRIEDEYNRADQR